MSVELVNGHVLFPNRADYGDRPKWARRWEVAIADGVTGAESRNALRAEARASLSFTLTPTSAAATQMLDDRLRAALKLGKGCAPFWGRGGAAAGAIVAGASAAVVTNSWPWQPGDYLFMGDEEASDARLVTAAFLDEGEWALMLDGEMDFDWPSGSGAWPLLFGKFACSDMHASTPVIGPVQITLSELVAARSAQLGVVTPPGGAGIGAMKVGTTLQIA